jgi:4-hydroxy-2-oxoheptanedioate aldolase
MRHILDTCRKHKVPAGLHCGSAEEARARIDEGWQFIAIGSELRMMLTAANDVVKKLGTGRARGEMAKY